MGSSNKPLQVELFTDGSSHLSVLVCMRLLSHVQLCDSVDHSPPGSSVHGISQARILECVANSFSGRSSPPRDQTHISCIGRWVLYHWTTREALKYFYYYTKSIMYMKYKNILGEMFLLLLAEEKQIQKYHILWISCWIWKFVKY